MLVGIPARPGGHDPVRWRAWAVAAVLALGACGDGGTGPATLDRAPAPTTTTVTAPRDAATTTTAGPATTTTTAEGLVVAEAQPATPTCPAVPAQARPDPDRPRYRLDLVVRPDQGTVDGAVAVTFVPDLPVDRLVFRLWPNGPRTARAGARLDVGEVTVDGRPTPAGLADPTILDVPLPAPAGPGEAVEATVAFRLRLPGAVNDRLSHDGDAIRLGSFFPILPWEPGHGWALDPPTSAFAEASTAPVADFDLTVEVPDGLDVLASGEPAGPGRWRAVAVRDVALSIGRFTLAAGVAHAPEPVHVTVGVHAGIGESPDAYLERTIRALEDFARRFGPYPYPRHTLAITPGLSGGIEYPTHVMQGPATIGRTTSHEVGHMWFYGLVGNNQGRDPWLDEGLATWAEAGFEGTLGAMRNRAIPAWARGRTGEPMTYWESRQSGYYRGVYVQGAQALAALGDAGLVDCALRHYVARHAFAIARPPQLIASLALVFPDAPERLGGFGIR